MSLCVHIVLQCVAFLRYAAQTLLYIPQSAFYFVILSFSVNIIVKFFTVQVPKFKCTPDRFSIHSFRPRQGVSSRPTMKLAYHPSEIVLLPKSFSRVQLRTNADRSPPARTDAQNSWNCTFSTTNGFITFFTFKLCMKLGSILLRCCIFIDRALSLQVSPGGAQSSSWRT